MEFLICNWVEGLPAVLWLEILQEGYNVQAGETSKHLVHQRSSAKAVQILHGVSVDGKQEYADVSNKAPKSQSLGIGRSNALVVRFSAHWFIVGQGHPQSRLSA